MDMETPTISTAATTEQQPPHQMREGRGSSIDSSPESSTQAAASSNAIADPGTSRPTVHIHITPIHGNAPSSTRTGIPSHPSHPTASGQMHRISIPIGAHPTPSNTTHNHTTMHRIPIPQLMPTPPLPPLLPQPLPHQRNPPDDDERHDDPSMKKFECAICFEYLTHPVGCGSCPVRFCKSCLERFVMHDLRQSSAAAMANGGNGTNNNNNVAPTARCPHCRTILHPSSIQIDTTLVEEMNSCTTTIPCPYTGCHARLTLHTLASHEKTCPHLPLKCRYEPWGCEWTGKAMELAQHESTDCPMIPLKAVIEKIRLGFWELHHVTRQHHTLIGMGHGMAIQNRQSILQSTRGERNVGNLWHVLCLGFEAACFPARFVKNKEVWGSMIANDVARALVCNQLLMLPWLGVVFRVAVVGMQFVPRLVYALLEGSDGTGADFWSVLDTVVLSLAITIMGILSLVCFYTDAKSPFEWTSYSIGNVVAGRPLMRDVSACCMAVTIFSWMEFFGSIRGFMLWHITSLMSLVYSSFVACMIEKVSEATNVLRSARALSVVVFGLRYGCLMYMCDLIPCIGAILAFRLAPVTATNKFPGIFGDKDTECFFSQVRSSHAMIGAVAYLAIIVAFMSNEYTLHPIFQIIKSVCLLVIINLQVHVAKEVGSKLAVLNCRSAVEVNSTDTIGGLDSSGAVLPTQRPSQVGATVTGTFALACALIATS
eukprot:CCRYP_003593-RA/>CCRYP_003593-RA protein AED:0.06 eAED:0.06 QI:0/-1/0/1/-1/1/1/0/711